MSTGAVLVIRLIEEADLHQLGVRSRTLLEREAVMAVTDEQHLREAYNCILSARGHIEQVADKHIRRDSAAMRDQLSQALDWLDTVILARWGRG